MKRFMLSAVFLMLLVFSACAGTANPYSSGGTISPTSSASPSNSTGTASSSGQPCTGSESPSASIKSELPETMPENFGFILNFGIESKNQLDTIKGTFTKDMVLDPSVTTELKLSEEEMGIIYQEMRKIDILGYPDVFSPESNTRQTPFDTYCIKIILEDKVKKIYWEDENGAQTDQAVQLRELFKKIEDMIENKEEFKKLPEARGAYA